MRKKYPSPARVYSGIGVAGGGVVGPLELGVEEGVVDCLVGVEVEEDIRGVGT